MATFAYTALDPSGRKRSGQVEASDQSAAVAQLATEGRFVVEICESAEARKPSMARGADQRRGRASRSDLALFTRRLADLSGAGLPLDRVLQVLSEQSESAELARVCESALDDIRTGLPVSEALARHPRLFGTVYTQTLRAGEASGQFSESAERLADFMEIEVTRKSQVVSALIYPGVLTVTAVSVVVFLLTFVIPRLSGVFEDMGGDLPLPTVALMAIADFIVGNWPYLLVFGAGSVVAYRAYVATPAGHLARDVLALRIPGLGRVLGKAVISRFARVLGTMVHGGVPILEALRIAGVAAGNKLIENHSRRVEDEVREGRGIAQAMKDTGAFPPVLTHMVAIGEETGDLPKMLGRIADSLDFEVDQGLRRLTSLFEPVIVLVMGGFVAFVVLSVMLPIFQAQTLVR